MQQHSRRARHTTRRTPPTSHHRGAAAVATLVTLLVLGSFLFDVPGSIQTALPSLGRGRASQGPQRRQPQSTTPSSTAAAAPDTSAESSSDTLVDCSPAGATTVIPGEYFDYYTIPAEDQQTPHYDAGTQESYDYNIWYAMGEYNSPIWVEYPDAPPHRDSGFWIDPDDWETEWEERGPDDFRTPVARRGNYIPQAPVVAGLFNPYVAHPSKGKRPVLTGLRLGDGFTYTGQAWPGRGVRMDGETSRIEGAIFSNGYYKVEEVPGAVSCNNYFFVYTYDPAVVSIERVFGNIAWWKDGQIATYTDRLHHCQAHCEPVDAYPNPVVRIVGRLIADPGVAEYHPLTTTILHRGIALTQPARTEGNRVGKDVSFVDDAHGFRWQNQAALSIHADATNPRGIPAAAEYPSSGELIAQLAPVIDAVTPLEGATLFLGRGMGGSLPTSGFVVDTDTQSMYFINAMHGPWVDPSTYVPIQVTEQSIEVPMHHLLAQNSGEERFAQGIIGAGLTQRFTIFLNDDATGWPQEAGYDPAADIAPILAPERGHVMAGTSCEIQPLRGIQDNVMERYTASRGVVSLELGPIIDGAIGDVSGYVITAETYDRNQAFFNPLVSLYDAFLDEPRVDTIRTAQLKRYKSTCDAMLVRNAFTYREIPLTTLAPVAPLAPHFIVNPAWGVINGI